jgi:alkylation response protein AidB-like acyl-CoA dehydrogenase
VNFDFTDVQLSWQSRGAELGRELAGDPAAANVVMGAARAGLLDPAADLLSIAAAVEAMAFESPSAAVVLALHSGTALAVAGDERFSSLFRGEIVAAVSLSSDDVPVEQDGKLSGRAPWVAPITDHGIAVVGPRQGPHLRQGSGGQAERAAFAVALDVPGVTIEPVTTAALAGVVCGHVTFTAAPCTPIGATLPVMIRLRILMAAAGLGMGRRALREALITARAAKTSPHGSGQAAAAGEQTVQGLLADAATELDAAMLITWKAALAEKPSLAEASMAKLASTGAAQRSVERATQVVGADSFQRGHIIERLAQDVRALELFAGRTEALREAVAEEELPRPGS